MMILYIFIFLSVLVNVSYGKRPSNDTVQMFLNAESQSTVIFPFPKEHTPGKRLLGTVLAFNLGRPADISLTLGEYLNLCEGGWDVNVILLSTVGVNWSSERTKRYLARKFYCSRIQSVFGIQTVQYDPRLGVYLAMKSRLIVKAHANDFDVFIYQEDDMPVTLHAVHSFLRESAVLEDLVQTTPNLDANASYMVGFVRIHDMLTQPVKSVPTSSVDYPVEKDVLVEKSVFDPVCLGPVSDSRPYLRVTVNTHQGMHILTREQLFMLDQRCSFFAQHENCAGREYTSSLSIFSEFAGGLKWLIGMPESAYCGVKKVIPFDKFESFEVLHGHRGKFSWDQPAVQVLDGILGRAKKESLPCFASFENV